MRLLILYGSQTGTAQDVAEQIWRESKTMSFLGPVLPMDDYPIERLTEEDLAVFVVATTGVGQEPDNMQQTWKFLRRRNLPLNSLGGLKFACLGLGDSSYEKFNYAAKKLHKRLQQLGALSIVPLGLCDDQHDHGLSAVAMPWIADLWASLGQLFVLQRQDIKTNVLRWNVDVKENYLNSFDLVPLKWPYSEASSEFTLNNNKRTTPEDHFQDVRLLQFTFPDDVVWRPGDVLQLRPTNSEEDVILFFDLMAELQMNFTAETILELTSVYDDMHLPKAYMQPVSIGLVAKYVWDLSHKPRQRAFEILALNCKDELEKDKLIEFTTAEGLDELIKYINRPKRTILEVLQDFRHATAELTLPLLFELFPIIQPRSFSIASVPCSRSLDLLVAVVEYKTNMSTPRKGLCSTWLKTLQANSKVIGAIKPGTLSLPTDVATPLIMVGPGTGIAPVRSIMQDRARVGNIVVFFGCRNKAKDYHFKEDFEKFMSLGSVQVFVAFSRDQEHKIYVQNLIIENKDILRDLIKRKEAFIFVTGSSQNMPKSVKEAFVEVLNGDHEYIEGMIKNKRYQEETWA